MVLSSSGIFLGSSYLVRSGPNLCKLGESLASVTPPCVSPTNKIGSLALNDKLVNFGYFTGLDSANFPCLSTDKS